MPVAVRNSLRILIMPTLALLQLCVLHRHVFDSLQNYRSPSDKDRRIYCV